MKKKILALLLSFVLLIPFVFVGCMPNNNDGSTTKSFFDGIKDTYEKEESVANASEIILDGTYTSAGSGFILVKKDASTETHATEIQTIYNIKTGKALTEIKLEREYSTGKYSSLYKSVSVAYGDGLYVVAGSLASGSIEYTVYNQNGEAIVKGADVSYRLLTDGKILFDKKLYRIEEDGKGTMVKDLCDSDLVNIIDQLDAFGNKHVYVNGSYVAYVFDQNYELLYKQPLKASPVSVYNDSIYSYFYLNNGNILFQERATICSFDPSINHSEYDYVANGLCYKVNTYLFNIENGIYKKVTIPYLLQLVASKNEIGSSIPYGYENMALGSKFDNNKLVYTGNSEYAFLLLSNDGGYKESDLSDVSILSENRYARFDGFTYSIYDEKDNLIGKLDKITDVNNDLIITPSAIYNQDLKVIYSLKDTGASVSAVLSSSVVVSSYDDELGAYKYELVTKDKISTIFVKKTTNSIRFGESFIYVTETMVNPDKELCTVLTVYSSSGEVLKTAELTLDSSVFMYTLDDCSILRAVGKDEKVLLIVLK